MASYQISPIHGGGGVAGFPNKIIPRHLIYLSIVPLLLKLYSTWKLYSKIANSKINYQFGNPEGVRVGKPAITVSDRMADVIDVIYVNM
jgi:hypothetical protein